MKKTLLLILLLSLLIPISALAQDENPLPPTDGEGEITDDDVNVIANQLYCPVCENVPLDVCGTQACADWRDEIRDMLEEGRNEAEIKAYFAERYGRRVLATPEIRGIDIVVWVAPILAVVVGLVVLVSSLQRLAPSVLTETIAPDTTVNYGDLDEHYLQRVEDELREYTS